MTANDDKFVEKALDIAVADLTPESLVAVRLMITDALHIVIETQHSINTQIEAAKVKFKTQGEPVDPEWLRRANSARRHKARQRMELQTKLTEVNGLIKQQNRNQNGGGNTQSRAETFIKVARLMLPEETFVWLWQVVDEIELSRVDPKLSVEELLPVLGSRTLDPIAADRGRNVNSRED